MLCHVTARDHRLLSDSFFSALAENLQVVIFFFLHILIMFYRKTQMQESKNKHIQYVGMTLQTLKEHWNIYPYLFIAFSTSSPTETY